MMIMKQLSNYQMKRPDLLCQALTSSAPKGFVIESAYTCQKFDLEGENLLRPLLKAG